MTVVDFFPVDGLTYAVLDFFHVEKFSYKLHNYTLSEMDTNRKQKRGKNLVEGREDGKGCEAWKQ